MKYLTGFVAGLILMALAARAADIREVFPLGGVAEGRVHIIVVDKNGYVICSKEQPK